MLQCCSVLEPQLPQNSPRVLLHQIEQVAFGDVGAQHVAKKHSSRALLVCDAVSEETQAKRQVAIDAVLGAKVSLHTPQLLWNCRERAHVLRVLRHETCEYFVYQEEGAPFRSLGRSSSQVLARNASPVEIGLVEVLQDCSADISGQVAFPSAVMISTRNIGHTPCSRSLHCHRRVESL